MDTLSLRQRLHNYLDIASDKKIEALYTIIEDALLETEVTYSPELIQELENRIKEYNQNPSSVIAAEESKKRINALISKAKN